MGGTRGGNLRYVRGLDGLRGVAVAGVLLFHGGHLQGGYLGVDLFFVLSGYLITSLLLAENAATGGINLRAFWARRARRLLPALALMLLGVTAYAHFVAQSSELHQIRIDALATIAYVANWRFVFEHFSYWSLFTAPSPLQHTWSLAIEEQFYIVWPLIFVLVARVVRRGRSQAMPRQIFVVSIFLALASGVWAVILYPIAGSNRVYYGTDTRAASLLLGAALAAFVAWRGHAVTRRARVCVRGIGVLGLIFLAVAWTRLPGTSPVLYRGGLFACSLAAVAVLASITHPSSSRMTTVFEFRPLVLLGMISYGVYLYHWPIFLWLSHTTDLTGWGLFSVQVSVTLAVSAASFLAVERPILHGSLRWPRTLVIGPAAAMAVATLIVVTTSGYVPMPATVKGADSLPSVTHSLHKVTQSAADASAATPTRLMVVGNSVAFFLAREGFEQIHTDPPLVVLNDGLWICAFPPEATAYRLNESGGDQDLALSLPCNRGWAPDVATFRPQVVLFTMGDLLGELRDGATGQWLRPCTVGFDDWFESSLLDAAHVLTAYGAHLVIATSAYSEYYGAPLDRWSQTDCMNRVEHEVGKLDPRTVSVVDLGRYVCPTSTFCRKTIDGVAIRPDGVHFRGRSALAISEWLLPQLTRAATGLQPVPLASITRVATVQKGPGPR
jgi:peptidoglycan/LPS O-acetylase OafA/YrhL